MNTKKITLQIEDCGDCLFCKRDKSPVCIYAQIMVGGEPMPLNKRAMGVHHPNCPLVDATENDDLPCPIFYRIDKDGVGGIVVRND